MRLIAGTYLDTSSYPLKPGHLILPDSTRDQGLEIFVLVDPEHTLSSYPIGPSPFTDRTGAPWFVHCGLHEPNRERHLMQAHRFAVGETVLCAERRHPHVMWRAPYTIIICVKTASAEPQYRIASVHRHEIRFVGEHELCRTPQPLQAVQQPPEQFLSALSCLQPANLNLKRSMELSLIAASAFAVWGEHPAPKRGES